MFLSFKMHPYSFKILFKFTKDSRNLTEHEKSANYADCAGNVMLTIKLFSSLKYENNSWFFFFSWIDRKMYKSSSEYHTWVCTIRNLFHISRIKSEAIKYDDKWNCSAQLKFNWVTTLRLCSLIDNSDILIKIFNFKSDLNNEKKWNDRTARVRKSDWLQLYRSDNRLIRDIRTADSRLVVSFQPFISLNNRLFCLQ